MKNENYLLNLHKIIPLWYEDVHPKGINSTGLIEFFLIEYTSIILV